MVPHGHRDDVVSIKFSAPATVAIRHVSATFEGPTYTLKTSVRPRLKLCSSIVRTADGLAYSLLGVRFERDVMARSEEESYCPYFGAPFEGIPLSGFDGFYHAHFSELPHIVATVASHHGRGAFVVPAACFGGPTLRGVYTPIGKSKAKMLAKPPVPWFKFLLQNARLTMKVPSSAVSLPDGRPWADPNGLLIIYAAFDYKGKFKAKLSRVKELQLVQVPELVGKIGVIPAVVTRPSPLAEQFGQHSGTDSVQGTDAFPPPPADLLPPDPPNPWVVSEFLHWCNDHPDHTVRHIASQAVKGVFDPGFLGDLCKTLVSSNSPKTNGREDELRGHMMKEVDAKRMWGPFSFSPFEFARIVRLSIAPKFKWDSTRREFRLISDLSQYGSSSVNDLCWTPDFISFHLRAIHLRDLIDEAGPKCHVYACDVPKAFRRQTTWKKLLPLFMYMIESKGYGKEFFVDLCNTFGFRPSEYVWQAILAVILWRTRSTLNVPPVAFVDNFFFFCQSAAAAATAGSEFTKLCLSVGITFHEVQCGQKFNGLGWDWVTGANPLMICPEDKFVSMNILLGQWLDAPHLSLVDVRSATGLMYFLSAGYAIGRADVASMIAMRTEMERQATVRNTSPSSTTKKLSPKARTSLLFWKDHFATWNRQCPIVGGFSPIREWERLGFVDASTKDGCGGIMYDGTEVHGFIHLWSDEERRQAFVKEALSTGALELMGVVHWFKRFGSRCCSKRLLLLVDNSAAVTGLEAAYSKTESLSPSILEARRCCAHSFITLRVRYINSCLNTIADHLSHNREAEARCLVREVFGKDLVLVQ